MSEQFAIYPSLRDRVVFITGGASGIGAEHVTQFAAQGAKVAFVDIADDAAHALAGGLEAAGHAAPLYQHCDLKDIGALQAAIAEVGETPGANHRAGKQRGERSAAQIRGCDGRVLGRAAGDQSASPVLRHSGGGADDAGRGRRLDHQFRLCELAHRAGRHAGLYDAKAGVEGLTRGMARDLGPDRIRVNTVIPGWIMTKRQIELWLTPEAEENLIRSQCLKNKLAPADVTRLVLWLASDDSQMCTAQLWVVDGGRM